MQENILKSAQQDQTAKAMSLMITTVLLF